MTPLELDQVLTRWRSLFQSRLRLLYRSLNPDRLGAVIGLALLLLVFSLLSPPFRQAGNLVFLAKNTAITIGIVAVGQTVVLISGGIDLSVSSVIALTGLSSAILMKNGIGPIPPLTGNLSYLAIGIGWCMGILIGAGQGWLITKHQMPAFIVTLGTMVGLRGFALAISQGAIIYGLPSEFKWFSDGHIGIIPAPVLIMLVIYIFTAYMLRNTKIGRYCHAIGGNETAARLSGINVDRYRIYFYAYSGLLAAVTGTILISFIDAAIYSHGDGFQFNSVAAAIIGGTSLTGGVGGIWGTLFGAYILAIIPSGMIMLNAAPWWRDVVTGVIIVLAVVIDVKRQKARKTNIDIEASQSIPAGYYLHDLLAKLSLKVSKYTGNALCRVYLVDRETGDLVPQDMLYSDHNGSEQPLLLGKSRIAFESKESGDQVVVIDLSRGGYQRVMPMSPEVQSALAFPLMNRERCIGVIELQSNNVARFNDSLVENLQTLTRSLLVGLEDAWLFESGWLVRQARDSLRHLWDDLYLGRTVLADWALPNQGLDKEIAAGARGESLRNLLLETMENLKPENHDPAHASRCYRILQLTYVQEQAVDQILRVLNISRRQYYYDLKDSIEVLADMLVRNHSRTPALE
jgi:ribose/xylose/arabinose/galactoside ABC-type transport system permease subunit